MTNPYYQDGRGDTCRHCAAPNCALADELHLTDLVEHKPDCPQNTGLYPVTAEDLVPHGWICDGCDEPFQVGDMAAELPLDGGTPDTAVMVCAGCAVLKRQS